MNLAVDVGYRDNRAWVAGILFRDWGDAHPTAERVVECEVTSDYRPGEFFRRELPCIQRLLREIDPPVDCIVVDGYVYLGSERRPGIGKHLFDALGQQTAVIGVAKTTFRDTPDTTAVFRGQSTRPLYVTAAGIPEDLARQRIRAMQGKHRIPTLLQRADRLCRQAVAENRQPGWFTPDSPSVGTESVPVKGYGALTLDFPTNGSRSFIRPRSACR
jgi:deoxyribonuclease V